MHRWTTLALLLAAVGVFVLAPTVHRQLGDGWGAYFVDLFSFWALFLASRLALKKMLD